MKSNHGTLLRAADWNSQGYTQAAGSYVGLTRARRGTGRARARGWERNEHELHAIL